MSAESVSEATDEAIQRAAEIAEDGWTHYIADDGTKVIAVSWAEGLGRVLASPEGRRALLDVLQPTPEELGGERLVERWWSCRHCGPHAGSTSTWCDSGCGRDHGGMTLREVAVWRFPTSESDER